MEIKGIAHLVGILSLFTHPHFAPNLFDLVSSEENAVIFKNMFKRVSWIPKVQ